MGFCREIAKRAANLVTLSVQSSGYAEEYDVGDFSLFPNLRLLVTHFHLLISQERQQQPPLPSSLKYLHLIQHPGTNLGDYVRRICEMAAPELGQLPNVENLDLTCQKSFQD